MNRDDLVGLVNAYEAALETSRLTRNSEYPGQRDAAAMDLRDARNTLAKAMIADDLDFLKCQGRIYIWQKVVEGSYWIDTKPANRLLDLDD